MRWFSDNLIVLFLDVSIVLYMEILPGILSINASTLLYVTPAERER